MKYLFSTALATLLLALSVNPIFAATTPSTSLKKNVKTPEASVSATATPSATPVATPTPEPRVDVTQQNEKVIGNLEKLLADQNPGAFWANPIKHMIRATVNAGVPANTLTLLLMLPLIAALIAAARHVIGLRGFGIFLPAALAIVFLAIGPIVGLGLFLIIVLSSTLSRIGLRKLKLRLHYMPRMALILVLVVCAVLLVLYAGSTLLPIYGITNVSIFPVLVLVLLSEDFSRVQLGKSFRAAFNLTSETLVLALVSYIFLTLNTLQRFVLLNPEVTLIGIIIFDFLIGKFSGLRFMEYYRFRKLIKN
jgi:hypothetical protein